MRLLNIALHSVGQELVRRRQIGSAAGGGIVSRTCTGWPGMEVAGVRKRLADDPGTDKLSALLDKLAICAIRKQQLSQAGNSERVEHPEHNGRYHREPKSCDQILFHKSSRNSERRQDHVD